MTRFWAIALVGCLSIGCGDGATTTETPAADPAPSAESGSGETEKGDGSGTKSEGSGTTEVKFNIEGLPTLAVSVPGIHCEACAAGVNETLAEVTGVKDVTVDVDTKVATVAIDKEMFDADTAIKALADAEFPDAELVDEGA